jgi:O-antigen ligase
MSPPPSLVIAVFGIASIPLLFSAFAQLRYTIPVFLLIWSVAYILVSLFSFLLFLSSKVALKELNTRFLAVLFIMIMLLVFSRYNIVQLCTRWAVFIAVLMAALNNIYEFFNPLVFNALNETGRPAGFYINPNQSGCALILGMIFSVGLLQPRYRVPFVSLIAIGVLLTFSRGAILGWFVVVMIFIIVRVIPRSQLLYWVLGIGMIIIGLSSTGGFILNLAQLQEYGLVNQNILGRLEWAENPSGSEDSADSRLEVARLAWQMFTEHPFWGNGIGSTQEWSIEYSTHNMYLYFMADHGILGAFILPLLVYAVTRHAHGESKYIGFAFAAFILLWGLFSHDIISERYILIMFSLMAAMTKKSQLEQRFQVRYKS